MARPTCSSPRPTSAAATATATTRWCPLTSAPTATRATTPTATPPPSPAAPPTAPTARGTAPPPPLWPPSSATPCEQRALPLLGGLLPFPFCLAHAHCNVRVRSFCGGHACACRSL